MADKATRLIQIPDPVHGYIPVEPRFMDIVDTPEFQRLRSIEQGSFRPIFPGARHDRFLHSLGTFYLATLFVDAFFENLKEDVEGVELDGREVYDLKTTFRYAALLHDVGHAPFSHTTEVLFKENLDDSGLPRIWTQLCDAVEAVAPDRRGLWKARTETVGAPHEIMSALLLIRDRDKFLTGKKWDDVTVDLELAARMVIGYQYSGKDPNAPADPKARRALGIRNCLIQLLNSKVMDVDRLDYLGRDTRMSGYVNAPLDLDKLAQSVTAVEEDGWLKPAFRSGALSAIETMFHAKLSHDAWVLGHPAGGYDMELRRHCIRQLNRNLGGRYIPKVFCVEAMGQEGVTLDGKTYRLLCDADIITDIKAMNEKECNELFTRQLGHRRTACWGSYYEFRYLFSDPVDLDNAEKPLTPEFVYGFFAPLMKYLSKNHIFAFTQEVYDRIRADDSGDAAAARKAAGLLHEFLYEQQQGGKHPDKPYSAVLLDKEICFTLKLDPRDIRILFTKKSFPKRDKSVNWTTYGALRKISKNDNRADNYFYLFRHGGLGSNQLKALCDRLREAANA